MQFTLDLEVCQGECRIFVGMTKSAGEYFEKLEQTAKIWYHRFIISAAFGPQGGQTMEKAKGNLTEVYIIRLEPGSDVLEEIEEACR